MRSVNPELRHGYTDRYNILNQGGQVWILGLKSEGAHTVLTTTDGGRTELLGAMLAPQEGTHGTPAFLAVDSEQSVSYGQIAGWGSPHFMYEAQCTDVRKGKDYTATRGHAAKRGGAFVARDAGVFYMLYTSRKGQAAKPAGPDRPDAWAPYRGGLHRTGEYPGEGPTDFQSIKKLSQNV